MPSSCILLRIKPCICSALSGLCASCAKSYTCLQTSSRLSSGSVSSERMIGFSRLSTKVTCAGPPKLSPKARLISWILRAYSDSRMTAGVSSLFKLSTWYSSFSSGSACLKRSISCLSCSSCCCFSSSVCSVLSALPRSESMRRNLSFSCSLYSSILIKCGSITWVSTAAVSPF